jgi:hypothetical protein
MSNKLKIGTGVKNVFIFKNIIKAGCRGCQCMRFAADTAGTIMWDGSDDAQFSGSHWMLITTPIVKYSIFKSLVKFSRKGKNANMFSADEMLSAGNIFLSADNIMLWTDNTMLSADISVILLAENMLSADNTMLSAYITILSADNILLLTNKTIISADIIVILADNTMLIADLITPCYQLMTHLITW